MIKNITKKKLKKAYIESISAGLIDIHSLYEKGINNEISEEDYQKMDNHYIEKYKIAIYSYINELFSFFRLDEKELLNLSNIPDIERLKPIKIKKLQELVNNCENIDISYYLNSDFQIIGDKLEFVGFNKAFHLENYNSDISFVFKNCNLGNGLFFHNIKFNSLIIENCRFEGKIEIQNSEGNIEINNPKDLKYIKVWQDDKNNDKELFINIIKIKFDKEGDYFFSGKNIKEIYFNHCINLSEYFKINKLDDVNLKFIDADLGKITFNGVSINKLYLENATLNNCVFNGVEFPKDYKLEKGKLSNKQLKDNYRQLKFVMDKNGNYTEGNRFFEWEMSYYTFTWNGIKRLHDNILGFFQLIISQFGNNWFLPLLWIILVGFIYSRIDGYYLISDFSNSFPFIDIKIDNYNKLAINSFFTNINPFDKSLFTKGGITYGNFIHKIILVILYWHLVIALKRTTKR